MARLYTRFLGHCGAWIFECDRRGHQRTPADRRGHFFVKIALDRFWRLTKDAKAWSQRKDAKKQRRSYWPKRLKPLNVVCGRVHPSLKRGVNERSLATVGGG